MALELGAFGNNATAARVELGNVTVPADVTYFVWTYRTGEGGANFGRIFGRSSGVHDLISNNPGAANTYAFGDILNAQHYRWTRADAFRWVPISISGTIADTSTAPVIYQNGINPTITRTGAGNFWGTTSSVSMQIGNRPSDSARVWHGMLAHFCMWDVKLTEDEHQALHAGALPSTIRPESIIRYLPLVSNDNNLFGVSGTAVSCLFSNIGPPIVGIDYDIAELFSQPAAGSILINANVATLAISGAVSAIHQGVQIGAIPKALVLTGTQSAVHLGAQIGATPKALLLTGSQAGIQLGSDVVISAIQASLTLAGQSAQIQLGSGIGANAASLSLSGSTASIQQGSQIAATIKAITLTGLSASVFHETGMIIGANVAPLTLSGLQAQIQLGNQISATIGSLSITGMNSGIFQGVQIGATPGALTLTGTQSSVSLSSIVNTLPYALTINGLGAGIISGGIVPVKSLQSIEMVLHSGSVAMTNYKGGIAMDASGETVGMTH
ncbi:MAG: hypothetical protein IPI97_14210 [Nitrosomonas sp.]|nr:hypothetical protein [Nitrosomonas sp.]